MRMRRSSGAFREIPKADVARCHAVDRWVLRAIAALDRRDQLFRFKALSVTADVAYSGGGHCNDGAGAYVAGEAHR